MRYSYFPNRSVCAVLSDMRDCFKTYNFGPILGLIEEVQVLANRMEAGLSDKGDIESLSQKRHDMKREVAKLHEELELLRKAAGKETKQDDN